MKNFLRAEHHGQFLWLLGRWDDVVERPFLFERDLVKKAQGCDGHENRAGGQLLFVSEVDLVRTNFLGSQLLWGFAEVPCKQGDLLQIGSLRIQGEISHLHVFGHALPKGCHGGLLCEMECAAASSNSMLSHRSTPADQIRENAGLPESH